MSKQDSTPTVRAQHHGAKLEWALDITTPHFAELQEGNDWGHVTYEWRGQAVNLDALRAVMVLWPDGTPSAHEVRLVRRGFSYGDMGHSYGGTTRVLRLVLDHHGHEVLVDPAGMQVVLPLTAVSS